MCGIAGFSRADGSRLNARALAHNLLAQIERRGDHASGFAWVDPDGSRGVYKQPKPGGQLSLHELPRSAQTVILHTRFATQGSVRDNRNNHPVMSTDNRVAVVHNGVISNDWGLRNDLGITKEHGDVDSLVIPSLIAQSGVESLNRLRGYAAIAWINDEDSNLRIARLASSPISYTWLNDGSFVFASTSDLLKTGITDAGMEHGGVFEMQDEMMMTIEYGFVSENEAAPTMGYDHWSYGRYSGATSGGHKGSESEAKTKVGSVTKAYDDGWQDMYNEDAEGVEQYFEDLEKWRRERDKAEAEKAKPMALTPKGNPPVVMFSGGEFIESYEDEPEEDKYLSGAGFYIIDTDGNINHFPTLDDLEARLRWLSKMTRSREDLWPTVGDDIYWVNYIMDLGSVDADGTIVSWVDDPTDIDTYESPAVRHLQYMREAVYKLETVKGA